MMETSDMSAMDYFRRGMELYEASQKENVDPDMPPPTPVASPAATPRRRAKDPNKPKRAPSAASVVWRDTLAQHRAKGKITGIPRKGTPEHSMVMKAYEKNLRKAAREAKKAAKEAAATSD